MTRAIVSCHSFVLIVKGLYWLLQEWQMFYEMYWVVERNACGNIALCLQYRGITLAAAIAYPTASVCLRNRKRDATKQGAFTWQYVIKKRCFLPLFYHLKMVFWGLTSFIYTRKSTNIIRYITCIVNFYSFFITLPKAEDIIFCKKIGTKTKCNYSQVSIPFRDKKGDFNIFMILLNGRYL